MKGPPFGPLFVRAPFVVEARPIDYTGAMVFKAQQIILCDHARLPWRFFGRLTAVQAGL
jgi:hypothetical protein